MAYFTDDFPVVNVTEADLYKLEEFVDERINVEPSFSKLGFLKVKLVEYSPMRQKTTVENFFQIFPAATLLNDVRQTFLVNSPNDRGLLGHIQVKASHEQASQYVQRAMQDPFFISGQGECNSCCMEVLRNYGKEALMTHLGEIMHSHANTKVQPKDVNKEIRRISTLATAKRSMLENRRRLLMEPDPSKKRQNLDVALSCEKVHNETAQDCQCTTCKFNYNLNEMIDATPLLYCSGIEETPDKCLHITETFAMAHVTFTSSLAAMDGVYSGVSYPSLYLGGDHSFAPIHVEDMSLNSFNMLLAGADKIWLVVPPTSIRILNEALCREGFGSLHQNCMNRLHHKYYLVLSTFLLKENIPFTFVRQQPGEGIILLPNAAHGVYNLGNNLAQACNFASKHWVPYGCVFVPCDCLPGGMVHEDLSSVVAIMRPDLLRAYLEGGIYRQVTDEYFQTSTIVPGPSTKSGATGSSITPDCPVKKGEDLIVRCPICPTTWKSVRKDRIKNHILKYHLDQV